jgi:hypothetical protein
VGLVASESVRGRVNRIGRVLSSNFRFADRSKGRGGNQASRVPARCVVDAGARIEGDT